MTTRQVGSLEAGWDHVLTVTRPALLLAPRTFLDDIRHDLRAHGVEDAVARRDSAPIFDWLQHLIQLQGISDAAAYTYSSRHGHARWTDIVAALDRRPACPRLRSHWHFDGCGYRKSAATCNEPDHLRDCPLPMPALRKGMLNQAAFGLHLFVHDVCGGDLVTWIDNRLAAADPGPAALDRATRMGAALIEPLRNVHGISDKLLSMSLADLLLGGDPGRERWVTTGAEMVAVDTLVHAFLQRTGSLRRLGAEHPYGTQCYLPGGCASVIEGLARRIDAREFNKAFPAVFPRFVQSAIWSFCAAGGDNICNGSQVDDRRKCDNRYCPNYDRCDRQSRQKKLT